MQRAIFLDIDEILTVSDDDIAVLPGVEAALKYYQNQIPRWVMVGISTGLTQLSQAMARLRRAERPTTRG